MIRAAFHPRLVAVQTLSGAVRTCASFNSRIAVVDLSVFSSETDSDEVRKQQKDAARQLSSAFQKTGFAIVVGHGIPDAVTKRLRKSSFDFFSLSIQEKRAVNSGWGIGYGKSPYCYMEENGAQLLGDFTRPNDIVESLYYVGLSKIEIQNALPQKPLDLKLAVLEHEAHVHHFRKKLHNACELALELEPNFLSERCDDTPTIRLAHYPEQELPPLAGQLRYGAHVDSYGLTILNLDPQHPEGLQVQIDGSWEDIPFIEGSYVMNVGACLSRWTNGLWKASVHRVLNYPGRRLSIVVGAIRATDETAIHAIGPSAATPKFPPIMMKDFVAERVAMHRPSYIEEIGSSDLAELGRQIRNYQR